LPAQITALPTPPSTNDPTNFNTRADAFMGQMPTFVSQANALATEVYANTAQVAADRVQTGADRTAAAASAISALGAPGTNGSSATSLTVGTGTKAFTVQTGKAWVAGQGFFLASTASPLNWMTGVLTAYNAGTGAATLQVDTVGGSGTFAAWNCGLAAGRPLPVATQAQAEAGVDSTTWMTPERTAQAAVVHAFPIGGVIQAAANPGSRWLPCSGLLYSIASYPTLASVLPPYINPMVLRLSTLSTNAMAYGAGVFVIWAYAGSTWSVYTSPDGVTWTQRTNPLGAGAYPAKLAFGGGLFLVCTLTAAYSSPDGVTWTARSHPMGSSAQEFNGLVWGGSLWMATGRKDDAQYVATSPDGLTWTPKPNPGSSGWPAVAAYSPTLSRWYLSTSNWATAWISDNNGSTWQAATQPTGMTFTGIVWGNGRFVAYSGGSVVTSTTGQDGFGQVRVDLSINIYSMIFDGARFIVAGTGGLASSVDGVSWTVLPTGLAPSQFISGVAKASSATTSPIIIAAGSAGLQSGLDASATQFQTPIVTSPTGLSASIKAL
jgi:hypothetical protein